MGRIWGLAALAVLSSVCSCSDKAKEPDPLPKTEERDVEITRPLRMTEQARVPQSDPNFVGTDVSSDRIVFRFSAKPKQQLEKGNVVAGSDADGGNPYLRRIVEVISASDTRVEVRTEAAYLTDFFGDGAFKAKLTPGASSWRLHADPTISGRRYLLDTKLKLMSYESKNGFSCTVAGTTGTSVTPKFEPDLKFEADIDIKPTFWPLGGELRSAKFVVDGKLTAGLALKIEQALSASCGVDIIKFLRGKGGSDKLFLLDWKVFIPMPLPLPPLPVTIQIEPVIKIDVGGKVKVGLNFAPEMTAGLRVGVELVDGQWQKIWQPTSSASAPLTFTKDSGEVTLSAKLAAGFKLGILIFDLAGPTFTVTHFAEGVYTTNPQTCLWAKRVNIGSEAAVGIKVQVPILGKELVDISKSFKLASLPIYKDDGVLSDCYADAGPEAGGDAGPETAPDAAPDLPSSDAVADLPPGDLPTDRSVADSPGDSQAQTACTPTGNSGWLNGNRGPSSPPNLTVSGGNGSTFSLVGGNCVIALVKGDTVKVQFSTSVAVGSLVSNYGGGAFIIARQPPADPTTTHNYDVSVKPTGSFGSTSITWSISNPNSPPLYVKYTLGITAGP